MYNFSVFILGMSCYHWQITTESGILDKNLSEYLVHSDRVSNTTEDFAFKGAQLIVPDFTKGRRHVEKSRMMYRARIHIEIVIGRLKDFKIIKNSLPINFVKKKNQTVKWLVDNINAVVAVIVNTNDTISWDCSETSSDQWTRYCYGVNHCLQV